MNIAEILKDCPAGTELYSPIMGSVYLRDIRIGEIFPIETDDINGGRRSFMSDGRYLSTGEGECMLFPSKENRDWSTFKVPKVEAEFKPFEMVLVRDFDYEAWRCNIFSNLLDNEGGCKYRCVGGVWWQCIPYEGNEELVGKTNKPE